MILLKKAENETKAKSLQELIEGIGSCLLLKYSHYPAMLWKNALPNFIILLETSLPLLKRRM